MGLENFSNGGPIMVPLAVCSILVLALLLERILALRKNLIVPNEQIKTIDHFLEKPDLQGLKDWSSDDKTPLKEACTILLTVSKNPENKRIECVQRLEEWGIQQAAHLERGLEVIAVVASIAPMLGLMGTVMGMVVTFDAIQSQGLGNVDALAGGISQALMTTLAGLAVGIPSLICHRWLLKMVDLRLLELQEVLTRILDACLLFQSSEESQK